MRATLKVLLVFVSMSIIAFPMVFVYGPSMTTSETTREELKTVSQTGYTVLFDEAHTALGSATMTPGNASFMAWILEEYGYICEMNFDQTLDSGILSGVDALVLVFPMVVLTSSEVTAVHNFVEAGGDLLLIGTDNSGTWHFSPANLNAVSETYGITFNMDNWLGIAKDMSPHHLTQDVSSIHSNQDYKLRGCTLTVESPATTVIRYQGNPVAAVSGAGSGKVVAVGCVASFLQYRWATTWQVEKDDLFQFSLNIFDWFADVSPRHVEVPDVAVITVGPGPALSPAELENYSSFTGILHEHTTHSDGQNTPMEVVWAGYTIGLDFMVVSDHSYEAPSGSGLGGITGALACRDITESNGLDIEQFIGAELSRGHHSFAFPLTENIYVDTQAEMVTGAHAQGAMIALCHPTIGEQYMETYEKLDFYGYDAMEVDNSGYTHGLLDEGLIRPFYGASDFHDADSIGKIVNIVFVETPSGPDGSLADTDVVDALLDRRLVIRDFVNNLIYGQKVWVDRYLELTTEAESEIENAQDAIELASVTGSRTLLAELYLRDAETALSYGNPSRAIRAALDAQTADALGISFEITSPSPRMLDPFEEYTLSLNITNSLEQGLQFNTTAFLMIETSVDTINEMALVPAGSSVLLNKSQKCGDEGYILTVFNLHDFNMTSGIAPVFFGAGCIIRADMTTEIEVGYSGTNVTIIYPVARANSRYLSSVKLIYDDGSGLENKTGSVRTVTLETPLGPYPKGTSITFHYVVYDIFGGMFVLPAGSFTVTTDPLEPTTTNGETAPIIIDPLLIAGIGVAAVAVIVIAIIILKKRGI